MIAIIVISSFALFGLGALVHAVRNAPLLEEKGDSDLESENYL